MRLCFFGSSLVSCYWNGAATYYRGLLKAFAACGVRVSFYEPDAYDRQRHRDMPDPDWARVIVYPATNDGWRRALDEAAADADVLVKASGVGVFDRELEVALPQAARPMTRAIYWDVDAPATLDAIAEDPAHHLRKMIPRYDAVFTYGGGPPVVAAYRRFGARLCAPIYNAVDPDTHRPAPARDDWRADLSFLGNRLPDREARVEEFFLKAAALRPELRFLLGGAGWEDKAAPSNVRRVGHVGTANHNAFFCSSRATLNVNRASMARYGFSPPTRIFEAAGAGACLVTDHWVGIEQFFAPGDEILVAASGEEAAAVLDGLDDAKAAAIGSAARARALAEHTYTQRARQALAILGDGAIRQEAAE